MEEKNLEKALDIFTALLTGQELSAKNPETKELYDEFYGNAACYDITMKLMKKLNLSVYEYNDGIYMTAGEGNRVFGYTNEDMKRMLSLRLNRELYMVYFIMYNVLLLFYKDSAQYQVREYVKTEEILEQVGNYLSAILKDLSVYTMTDLEEESFKTIALLWDELPPVTADERSKASRASKAGYVKLSMNFLVSQKLFVAAGERYYPTDRMKALCENYFEDARGKLYSVLGGENSAQH